MFFFITLSPIFAIVNCLITHSIEQYVLCILVFLHPHRPERPSGRYNSAGEGKNKRLDFPSPPLYTSGSPRMSLDSRERELFLFTFAQEASFPGKYIIKSMVARIFHVSLRLIMKTVLERIITNLILNMVRRGA